ncbi:phospholipid-transporting ATPase ABCA3 isoform X2 [Zeugodacus cucurbitae]|uniref:phospholipid-transporting ATPase ABCA3 isoform X2 n=1 Tax=Zeugodacus cucurbitae TaxID=28588 RepID=UPI0023D9296D|nr:phospholipid-transporting ATPase ABCA3 isoform X2 [Zeugodacus cucurbitae]
MPASIKTVVNKNFKFEIRSLKKTFAEIVVLVICYLLAVLFPTNPYINQELSNDDLQKIVIYDEKNFDNLDVLKSLLSASGKEVPTHLVYMPEEEIATSIMNEVATSLGLTEAKPYKTEKIMMNRFDHNKTLAAVKLLSVTKARLDNTLRFPHEFRTKDANHEGSEFWETRCSGILAEDAGEKRNYVQDDLYLREGFLQLQHKIFAIWLSKVHEKDINSIKVILRSFRQHTKEKTCPDDTKSNIMMFSFSFAFFLPFLNILWRYGREREENILAHHWRYGYDYAKYWTGNCIVSFVHLLMLDIFVVIVVLLPFEGKFSSSIMWSLLYLITYNIALLITAVFVVSISTKALHAVLFGATIWLTMYCLFSILVEHHAQMSTILFICFISFFNNGFAYGMRELQEADDYLNPLTTMLGSCVFYWILISIAEYFSPGPYIKTLPFSLCCSGRCLTTMNKPANAPNTKKHNILILEKPIIWENFEFGTISSVELIRLKNIHTKFNSGRVQLKNITMRVYANEITVIFGPHCSGKTTIIELMAGWRRPILGQVQVEHNDLYEHWNKYRGSIDVCMPNNALFDLLTVEETLIYYMLIKMPARDNQTINMELDNFFESTKGARIQRKMLVKSLTYSQKRFVSLGCAIVGGPKIILLDEPTLHMKGKDQRLFWNILHKEKYGRAIVMTTFDVTEAEAVGDRIAMLGEGALLTYGTPFFLRSKFGVGCDLIIVKSDTASTEAITELIGKFIPGVIPENEIGELLYYKLPLDMRPKFQNMLIHLEKEQKNLGIIDMRALSSEITEIYMTMGTRKTKQVIISDKKPTCEYISSGKLGRQQTYALLNKKLIHQAPNFVPLITMSVSFLFILLITIMARNSMNVPPTRYNPIQLGATSDIDLTSFKDCKNIQISDPIKQKGVGESSFKFDENSLRCLHVGYENYLKKSISVLDKYGAVEINGDTYTCWINQHIFHTAPLVLNLMHNIYLVNTITDSKAITTIANHPEPPPLQTKLRLLYEEKTHLLLPMVLGIAIPISIACFIIPLVEERKCHLLTLQKIAGVSTTRYWCVNFLWDFITFFSYSIVYTIILALSPIEGYSFSHKLYAILLMNIYGVPGLGLIYLLSIFFYYTMWSAFLVAVLMQVGTGIFAYIVYWNVFMNNEIFFYIWAIFPTFSLMEGISNVYTKTKHEQYCAQACEDDEKCEQNIICDFMQQCCSTTIFKFEHPGILIAICYMLGSALFLFFVICVIECRKARRRFSSKRDVKTLHSATYPYDDRDVVELKQNVAEQDLQSSLKKRFMVDQLEYKIMKKVDTLDTISFIVNEGQCLAIFGSRHSGKSHVAGQLIGQTNFAFGDIFVDGVELKYESKKALAKMSFVPQDHGLWETFTPREILRFFCMLRGIVPTDVKGILRDLSSAFIMGSYMDKPIRGLSVDRRRKVNIALALIAQPTIIILDEPTRGLSPRTCREIWNVLRYKRFMGKTIIFTTSNAIELEALADRVLIYNEGEMWAFGNAQYLRSRYTKGFYLDVKLKIDGTTAGEAKDKVRIDNCFKFYLPVPIVSYSFLYGSMEKNKRRLNIAEYGVSQGTLQDVFNAIEVTRNEI